MNVKIRNMILNVHAFELYNGIIKKQQQSLVRRYCTDTEAYSIEKEKKIHPYRKLHPWKSLEKFSQNLVDNVIYNKDGLVAINKPYGISPKHQTYSKSLFKIYSTVPDQKDYTLSDAMPFVAKELGYPELVIVKSPEKFMTGVTLLAADEQIERAIQSAYRRASSMNLLHRIYWFVTIRKPNQIQGEERLCLMRKYSPSQSESKIVIAEKWSKNSVKKREVKLLTVEYNVISNSTCNLSSLIEVKTSTIKWHALRLFASTRLYTPILGDNIYANRIHKVAGHWVLTNPFVKLNNVPNIDKKLLEFLYLSNTKRELIPCHIHARQVILPRFFKKDSITLEAPLIPPLDWTCKQLKFDNIPEFEKKEDAVGSLNT